MKHRLLLLISSLSLAIAACTAAPSPSNMETVTETSTEETIVTEEATATQEDTPVSRGQTLFTSSRGGFACATCHYASTARLLGPGLANIAERVETYGIDEPVEDYIRRSILEPTAFIAPADPAYPPNIMPTTYSTLFSDEEISDLIAYILSL